MLIPLILTLSPSIFIPISLYLSMPIHIHPPYISLCPSIPALCPSIPYLSLLVPYLTQSLQAPYLYKLRKGTKGENYEDIQWFSITNRNVFSDHDGRFVTFIRPFMAGVLSRCGRGCLYRKRNKGNHLKG